MFQHLSNSSQGHMTRKKNFQHISLPKNVWGAQN